jgi:tetratricopeptide (TPR) repeat protein
MLAAKQNTPTPVKPSAHLVVCILIAFITFFLLSPCLQNQFTNWDDPGYVTNNGLIKDISPAGLKNIFSTPVMSNYHPLTILSYAIEYRFAELEPELYHLDNLLLHILASILVYWFVFLLTGRLVAAIFTALLFSIHPMHVEPVAWVSGRKDLLMAIFYFGACISYLYYLQQKKMEWYLLTGLLFVFAILSKPLAVTLPVVLLLIDHFRNRGWERRLAIEKIPLFVISVIFGMVAIRAQQAAGALDIDTVHYNFFERIGLAGYAFITYLWKAIIPVHLLCFYPYPDKVGGALPSAFYLYPLLALAGIFIVWKYARKNNVVVFGAGFFIVNIALVLQLVPVGEAIVAERYSYLSYTGLFFIAGWYFSEFMGLAAKRKATYPAIALAVVYLGILGYGSYGRSKVWYDSVSLWRDELKKEPEKVQLAYDNLSFVYFDRWENADNKQDRNIAFDSAFYLLRRTADLWPNHEAPYQALGMLYYSKKKYVESEASFRRSLELNPSGDAHANFGNFLVMIGKHDSAIRHFSIAIDQNPDMYAPYLNRGKLLKRLNNCIEATKDFTEAIELMPNLAEAYYERSSCYLQAGLRPLAVRDVQLAISLGYSYVDSAYYNELMK